MAQEHGLKVVNCNNQTASVLGVVLAGGKSYRMGEDKASLKLSGVRLVDHMSTILASLHPPLKYIVVSGTVSDTPFIPDLYGKIGPIGGIASIVECLDRKYFSHVLLVPVDMPNLNEKILNKLLNEIDNESNSQSIHFIDYELPLLLKLSPTLSKILRMATETPAKRSIKWLINQLNSTKLALSEEDDKLLLNINYKQEWNMFTLSKENHESSTL
jgi:molybdenum cofactor guanylyltransferase